jgi:Variant SH3 domain
LNASLTKKKVFVPTLKAVLPPPPLPAKPVAKPVVRIFVALFDYDPPTMSPNPDACDEELPFREGQLIKVYGEKDADGFYWGEAGSRTGYVPCNMVSEVQVPVL